MMSDGGKANCPLCHEELNATDRNDRMIVGSFVLRCRPCKVYWIEGDTELFSGPDSLKNLTKRAITLMAVKVDREIMTSDIDDPRWTRVDL